MERACTKGLPPQRPANQHRWPPTGDLRRWPPTLQATTSMTDDNLHNGDYLHYDRLPPQQPTTSTTANYLNDGDYLHDDKYLHDGRLNFQFSIQLKFILQIFSSLENIHFIYFHTCAEVWKFSKYELFRITVRVNVYRVESVTRNSRRTCTSCYLLCGMYLVRYCDPSCVVINILPTNHRATLYELLCNFSRPTVMLQAQFIAYFVQTTE